MVSEKAFKALSESSEGIVPQTAQSQEQPKNEDKERKRRLRSSMIKLGSLTVFAFVVILFATIAWFSMSKEVGAEGVGVKVAAEHFEISMLANSKDSIFKNPYHIAVHEESALYWQMTPTNNLINYNEPVYDENNKMTAPGDRGIHPGTEGVISFIVTPKVDNLNLSFNFEIIGYKALYNDVNNTPDISTDDELEMKKLSELPNNEVGAAHNLINGHILLFENRTETIENGNTVITYSDPILSDEDMKRTFNRSISGKNSPEQINIYWVWPNTLSTLVDASPSGITTKPFTYGDAYARIVKNIEDFPQYYLKGTASDDHIDAENDIAPNYEIYGDMYDQGDNEIGMRVHYLLIKLSVTEGTAGGGGS